VVLVLQLISAATELYDGATWTTIAPIATEELDCRSRNTTAALACGGSYSEQQQEEWTGAGAAVTKTITVS
jgi:hypothetical protein